MGERERERDRERETSLSPSLMFLSLSLKWFRNGAFVISFFPQRQRQMQSGEKGQRGRILEGKGWGVEGEGKREASGQYTRTRANFKAKHPKGGEKERREQNYRGTTFFFFSFLFFCFGEVAKHDFYGIVLQSGSVKSSQVKSVRQEEEQGEQRARERERRGREREAGVVCTCARVSVSMCVCMHKGRFRKEEDMLCVCECV